MARLMSIKEIKEILKDGFPVSIACTCCGVVFDAEPEDFWCKQCGDYEEFETECLGTNTGQHLIEIECSDCASKWHGG